jgi:hypothetical protein
MLSDAPSSWTGPSLAKDAVLVARRLGARQGERRVVLLASLGHPGLAFDIARQIGAAAAAAGPEPVLILDLEGAAAGLPASGDLLDCLEDGRDAEAIRKAAHEAAPGLFALKAARLPQQAEAAAAMRRAPILFDALRAGFALVLIAAGRIDRDAWSNVIASEADGSLLAVVTGVDRVGAVQAARDALLALDMPLIGAIDCAPERNAR